MDPIVLVIIGNIIFFGILFFFLYIEDEKAEKEEIIKQQQEAKERERERQQEIQAIKDRIAYYKQSDLTQELLKFLKQFGTPYEITINHESIEVIYNGGSSTYDFKTHGIHCFSVVISRCNKPNTSEIYMLGCALNELMDNLFTVSENGSFDGADKDLYIASNVRMTRPLREF